MDQNYGYTLYMYNMISCKDVAPLNAPRCPKKIMLELAIVATKDVNFFCGQMAEVNWISWGITNKILIFSP